MTEKVNQSIMCSRYIYKHRSICLSLDCHTIRCCNVSIMSLPILL